MYIIDVKVSEDRFVECENIYAGEIGENNVTKLKFTVPKDYKDFFKYLDIIKSDGEKTQTVIDDYNSDVFYYTLPFTLTDKEEITLQLVMKYEEKVFKSNIFVLHFNGSIDGTQKLTGDYQDTIEYLMENKASKEEIKEINDKLLLKTSKNEFYNFCVKTNEDLNKKAENSDFVSFKNNTLNNLSLKVNKSVFDAEVKETSDEIDNLKNNKVDKTAYEEDKESLENDIVELNNKKVNKVSGKGLSEEDYTKEEKQKLSDLPKNAQLQNVLNSKASLEALNSRISTLEGNINDKLSDKVDVTSFNSYTMSMQEDIGKIETALDNIITIQEALIGGDSE